MEFEMQAILYGSYPSLSYGYPLLEVRNELKNWPSGWFPILDALINQLEYRAKQVGAKHPVFNPANTAHGIEFEGVSDAVHAALIVYANRLVSETCMVCGAPGEEVAIYGIRCYRHSDQAYGMHIGQRGEQDTHVEEGSGD